MSRRGGGRWRQGRGRAGGAGCARVRGWGPNRSWRGWRLSARRRSSAALVLTALTTMASAQRWRLVGRAYGSPDDRCVTGVAAYYQVPVPQLRAARRRASVTCTAASRTGRWGRWWPSGWSGQAVQVALAGLVGPGRLAGQRRSPPRCPCSAAALGGVLLLAAVVLVLVARGWLEVEVVPPVLALSALASAGHAAVFVGRRPRGRGRGGDRAARGPRSRRSSWSAAIPVNLAGWGLREGAAAWAFAAAGLGAATGATVAVAYGVLAFVATLPGAVLLRDAAQSAGQAQA